MNTCLKCGKPIEDGELFCAECSLNPGESAPHEAKRYEAPAGQMRAPVRVEKPAAAGAVKPKKEKAPETENGKSPRGVKIALALVSVLALAFLTLAVYQYATINERNVELRVREDALSVREAELGDLQTQLDAQTEALSSAEQTVQTQKDEIKTLKASLAAAENAATQSQYDVTTQQTEIERLTQEKTELELTLEDAQDENAQLSASVDTLSASVQELTQKNNVLSEKAKFMDTYVVFVENDKSGLYHRYDCAAFARKSFWAYSRKLAENNGYHACPSCIG